MIKLLWRTDIHDSDQTPGSRTDNWPDTVGGKIRQVGQIAKDQGCVAVLDGGDYFNNKFPMRTSHKLVNRVVSLHDQYPCEVWANVGNHDCRQSQIDNLAEGPLGVLFSAGVFRRCYDEHEAVFTDYARKVRVVGIPYHGPFYDMERFKIEKGDEDYLVCMAHVLASASGGTMFKSEDIIKYDQLLELAPDVDVWCFLPGTKVLDWNGRQFPIEEVRGSLALMGRHGESVVVTEVHPVRQIDEDIIKLDVEGVPGVLMPGVTGEHPFWVAKDLKCHLPSRSTPAVQVGWVDASRIQEGDYVAVPVPVPSSPSATGVSNPQRARLLGLYLAEGHLLLDRAEEPVAGVAWSFHEGETALLDEVAEGVLSQFGLNTGRSSTTGACTQIRACGAEVAEWFMTHGGRYSHAKSFSSAVWSWSVVDKMELLLGWLLGDGHARDPEKSGRIRTEVMGGTASPQLASQMYLLALGLGLRPSYSVRPAKQGVEILGRVCDVREFHVISFYGDDGEWLARLMGVDFQPRTKTKIAGFFYDGMYFARVRSVAREHYSGPVYNMRTSNEEYIAGMLVTHNCFGHWHKDQGITEIAPNKWVVNIGSLTRGTLAQDDIDRHPSVACLTFGGNGLGGKISIEKIPLEIQDAKSVFDLTKRTKEEAREMVVDAFVESVQKDLQNKSDKPFSEIVSGMKNVPHKVRERALEFIEKATGSVK